MSKLTFTIEDQGDKLNVQADFGGDGVNKDSPAHKMAAILMQWMKDLDAMPAEAPKVVFAAEDVGERRAEMVRHLGSKPLVMHAPWAMGQ